MFHSALVFLIVVEEVNYVFGVVVSALSVSLSFDDDDRLTGDYAIIIIITVLIGCCDILEKN